MAVSVNDRSGYRRRAVLATGLSAAFVLAACQQPESDARSQSDKALRAAFDAARSLQASYNAAIDADAVSSANDTFAAMESEHRQHVETLAKILNESPEAATSSIDGDLEDGALDTLREAETDAYTEALESCVAAPQEYAVLLAEIAACRSSHVDALEELS